MTVEEFNNKLSNYLNDPSVSDVSKEIAVKLTNIDPVSALRICGAMLVLCIDRYVAINKEV